MTYFINRLLNDFKMWKFLIRGLRDTVVGGERAITAAVENCQGNLVLVGNGKNADEDTKSNSSESKAEDKQGRGRNPQLKLQAILEAVGLSTVLWLGAYTSNPLCWRKHRHDTLCPPAKPEPRSCRYKGLIHLIAGTASAQPLVTNRADCASTTRINDNKQEPVPVQVEDLLEVARVKLQATSGYIDNRLGVACVNKGWHTEALNYFEHAWKLGNVGACYNLAVCYELGLGTSIDPAQAVQYYQKACRLGHATAMYNLGVYYAQGRGGLPVDVSKAKQLFEDAAIQGVEQAMAALELELEEPTKSETTCNLIPTWQVSTLNSS